MGIQLHMNRQYNKTLLHYFIIILAPTEYLKMKDSAQQAIKDTMGISSSNLSKKKDKLLCHLWRSLLLILFIKRHSNNRVL